MLCNTTSNKNRRLIKGVMNIIKSYKMLNINFLYNVPIHNNEFNNSYISINMSMKHNETIYIVSIIIYCCKYYNIEFTNIPLDELYEKIGFNYKHTSEPGYWYVINKQRQHRFNWRKSKLVKLGYDKNKTEWEIMNELGYYRIFNAGNKKWELCL